MMVRKSFGRKSRVDFLWLALVLLIFGAAALFVSARILDRPQMYLNASGECGKAFDPQGDIPCGSIKKEDYGEYDISRN